MDEVQPQWRAFGIALGLSYADLKTIEEEGKPDRCIMGVYGEWSQKKSSTYHWKGLIAALNTAGFIDLATRVTSAIENLKMPSPLGKLFIKNCVISWYYFLDIVSYSNCIVLAHRVNPRTLVATSNTSFIPRI